MNRVMVDFDINEILDDIKQGFNELIVKIKNFDFNKFVNNIQIKFNSFINGVKNINWKQIGDNIVDFFKHPDVYLKRWYESSLIYFSSLTQPEVYAWACEGVGFLMVVVALILW